MNEHPPHLHIVQPVVYLRVLVALMILMTLTIVAAKINLGGHLPNLAVALIIAVTKMMFIILFFMHVKYSSKLMWVVVGAGFFWFLIFVTFTLTDFLSRSWHTPYVPSPYGS